MNTAIRLLLLIGVALSSLGAITASVRIILGFALGTDWFWGGVVAAYVGPFSFAASLYFFDRAQLVDRPDDAGRRTDA